MRPRWANTTDRVALNADQVQLLTLMIHEKIEEGSPFDEPGREQKQPATNTQAPVRRAERLVLLL